MKHKVFTFRIIEKCYPELCYSDETIHNWNAYYLYVKVPWYKGFWEKIDAPGRNELGYFISIESAKTKAQQYVDDWVEYQKNLDLYKKHKKELKVTTKIMAEFNIFS